MTRDRVNAQGEGMVFADGKEASRAYYADKVDLQARVKVRIVEVLVDEVTVSAQKSVRWLKPR